MFDIQTNKYLYKHIYLHLNQSEDYVLVKEDIDMRKGLLTGASVLVVVLLLFASMPADFRSKAGPPFPHNAWGIALQSDGVTPIAAGVPGETITAWVDGVLYGMNVTTAGSAYEVDTIGNWTMDDTPEVKEGGWYNEDIMYMHGNGTSFDTNVIFQESSVWDEGFSLDWFNISEADMGDPAFASFSWLVINNITVDSMLVGNNVDYVNIYNPGATAIDLLGNYAFQKNDGNNVSDSPTFPINTASLQPNQDLGLIGPGNLTWVNLSAILGLNIDSADELKLVWINPGGMGAPFDGNPVIVDRVEWGNQSIEPDNTTMGDAPATILTNTISRIVLGQDTNNCTVDFDNTGEFAWQIVIPAQVVVTATNADPHIQLDWTPIPNAFGYKIYVHSDPTFAGYVVNTSNPFAVLVGWTASSWTNLSGYSSPENYGYIVRSYASGGENTTDYDNIAYKLQKTLADNIGKFAGHNYVSLPYQIDPTIATAFDLATEFGIGTGRIYRWVAPNWDNSDFPIVGGEAYRVDVSGLGDTPITIVGAHRGAPLSLQYGAFKGEPLNFKSLPYHTTLAMATDLMASTGSERVATWDGVNNLWLSKTDIGVNFTIVPGEGYLIVTTAASMWAPPVRIF
jgi:hypothetical protein